MMKRLSEEEYNPEEDPSVTNDGEGGVATQEKEGSRVHTTQEEATGQSETGRLLPDGLNSIEGEIPDAMTEGGGDTPEADETADEDASPTGEEGEDPTADAEDDTGAEEEANASSEEDMDDVPSSQGWLDDVTAKTGLDAENEDEFVDKVRTMQRDVRGFSELEQVLEQVPQAASLIHSLAQTEGEIDPVDFYMAAQDVDGIDVQAPSKAENPDEYADFKSRLRDRQKEMKKRREERQKQQKKAQEIRQDFEQAFKSFKKRKGLDDEAAQAFKEEFARVFYGDADKGELPRMDVFDLAYDALRGQEDEEVAPEETEGYKKGYNQAIEDMKDGGADGLPDLKNASGTGTEDGGSSGSGPDMPSLLQPSGGGGMNHDQF